MRGLRLGRSSINPSAASTFIASRSGVRDTPSSFDSLVSWVCDPGGSSPRMIIVRIRAAARSCRPIRLSLGDFRPGLGSDFCGTPAFLLTCDRS